MSVVECGVWFLCVIPIGCQDTALTWTEDGFFSLSPEMLLCSITFIGLRGLYYTQKIRFFEGPLKKSIK